MNYGKLSAEFNIMARNSAMKNHITKIDPQTLLNSKINAWIYLKNEKGIYLGCNDLMARSLGMKCKDVVNLTDWDLPLANNETQVFTSTDKIVLETGQISHSFDTATCVDTKYEFMVVKIPLVTKKKVAGLIGISYLQKIQARALYLLTQREQDVFKLLQKGFTAKMIGKKLLISPRTVEFHVINIKKKLDAKHRTDLLERVLQD